MERNQGKNETLQGTALSGGVRAWKKKKKNLPSSLVRDNRKREDLLDLRCLECRLANRSLRSVHVRTLQQSVSDPRRHRRERLVSLLQRQCDRCQHESRALAFQRCSFLANSCHLPFIVAEISIRSATLPVVHALCDFARLYDPFELLHDQWTNPH